MAPKRKAATAAASARARNNASAMGTRSRAASTGEPPAKRGRRLGAAQRAQEQDVERQYTPQQDGEQRQRPQRLLNQQRPSGVIAAQLSPSSDDVNNVAEAAADDPDNMRELISSTALPSGPRILYNSAVDPTLRLAQVLERTLNSVREASFSEGNSRLVNRLTTAKALPNFSGDPLEWLHFKEAYMLSSELGGYSEPENVARLFTALKGKAREVVSTLLASSRDAKAIMRTLELHFGNKKIVAEKIVSDLKQLPEIESKKINLIQFATKLQNSVIALKNLKLNGYLQSPDLIKIIGSKLPSALKYNYNRFAASATADESDLEKLSNFVYAEAELAAEAGIFDLEIAPDPPAKKSNVSAKSTRPHKKAEIYAVNHESEDPGRKAKPVNSASKNCVICKRDNHFVEKCFTFKREPLDRRWTLAKRHNLCFGCLKTGHSRNSCKKASCSLCKKQHHTLLHNPKYATNVDNPRPQVVNIVQGDD